MDRRADRGFEAVAGAVVADAHGRKAGYEEPFRANETRLAQLLDTMNRLGRIV